nr:alpha/beta hydrolase fold domain-containing protein [Novosphingobium arvoryzae]
MVEADANSLTTVRNLSCPGPAGDIRLRLYDRRGQRDQSATIVYFHGGGFVVGDLESHHSLCTAIAEQADLPVVPEIRTSTFSACAGPKDATSVNSVRPSGPRSG